MNILYCIKLALSTVSLSPQSLHSPLIKQTLGAARSFLCIWILLWGYCCVFEKPEQGIPGSSFLLGCTNCAADSEADPPLPLVFLGGTEVISQQTPLGCPGPVPQDTPGSFSGCTNLLLSRVVRNGNNIIKVKKVNELSWHLLWYHCCGLIELKFSAWTSSKWIKKYLFYVQKLSA